MENYMVIGSTGQIQYAPEDKGEEVVICDDCGCEIPEGEENKDYYMGKYTGYNY